MIEYRDECIGCASPGYPCRGSNCPYQDMKVLICDRCDTEYCEELYEVDGEQICRECLLEAFPKITFDD